jgi:hypothetical protein
MVKFFKKRNTKIKKLSEDEESEMKFDVLEMVTDNILSLMEKDVFVKAHISLYSDDMPRFFRVAINYKQKEGKPQIITYQIISEFENCEAYRLAIANNDNKDFLRI